MLDLQACLDLVYQSYMRVAAQLHGYDQQTRDPQVSRQLFVRLGLAGDRLPAVLVSGSKGKGSTALLCAAMLQGMGFRVGLVTSPHLVDFRERIRVDGRAISVAQFVRIMNRHAAAIGELDRELAQLRYIGPNGIIFACALQHFAEQGVDVLVLEAGRGGRYDEVSLFPAVALCLTPIMGEHLDKLGPTLADVAWHKTGIISPGATVACAPQPPEVAAIIAAEAATRRAHLLQAGAAINYRSSMHHGALNVTIEVIDLTPALALHLRTRGAYQELNAALAATAAAALAYRLGRPIDGLERLLPALRLPGRCETLAERPLVLVDGAINRTSAEQFLAGALSEPHRPTVLVTALPADKDHEGLLSVLAPHVAQIIITEANNPHLRFNDAVAVAAQRLHPAVQTIRPSAAAFAHALALAGPTGAVWIAGTQSLVRDALRYWQQDLETIWVHSPA